MANKRQVKKSIKQLQRVKTWQLFVLLLLMGLISLTFLRLNNIGMVERRDAVLAADESEDVEVIQNRLYDLQRYVNAHMNADPGRVALNGQYTRDSQEAKREAEAVGSGSSNGKVYRKAANVCDAIAMERGWRWPDPRYIACIDDELSKYPAANGPVQNIQLPDVSLYYHSYTSPVWSPDFAGWSLVVCGVIVLMIITRLVSLVVLRMLLKRHYRSI